MQRTLLPTLLCLSLAPMAQAADVTPGVDVFAGAYGWDAQPTGSFSSTVNGASVDNIDVEDDLDFGGNRNDVFYIGVEHAVPLLPNLRVRSADISDSARSTLNRDVEYEGNTYNASTTVDSSYQLDYTEATLYYSPWETVAKIDIGLTARQLDAKFAINDVNSSQSGSVAAEATLPMIHVGVGADLPLTGFYVDGEVDAISYDGNSLTDARAAVGWRSDFALGVEAGYQQMSLGLDDVDDLDANLDLGGPFLSLSVEL